MKALPLKEIKSELGQRSPAELLELCLRLARFKKENKELLTYLLFESLDERGYVESVKQELEEQFGLVNRKTWYLIKKSIRKILRTLKKYARYSPRKETEVELLIWFCGRLIEFRPSISKNVAMQRLFERQVETVSKLILSLHEDLQHDYRVELENVTSHHG